MSDLAELHAAFRAQPVDGIVNLAGYDSAGTPFIDNEADAEDELEGDFADRLFDQHELLYANEDRAVLLVLQGIDCSGKNGTIKHVVIKMNPTAVRTASFAEPTKDELEHHFLWRYRNELPAPGQLGVFDRSYYEDLLVCDVYETIDEAELRSRIDEINDFETELHEAGTIVIKCMLHISFDEQRERFLRRLRRDDKRWKFAESDLETRARWNDFQSAYGRALGATSTDSAPWLIIPADHKWYRNWAIARLLIATFESMSMSYPQPDLDLDGLRQRLAPPN